MRLGGSDWGRCGGALAAGLALGLVETFVATAIDPGLTLAATFALFSLSYSVWNEAFWATIGVAAAGVILLDRATRPEETPEP